MFENGVGFVNFAKIAVVVALFSTILINFLGAIAYGADTGQWKPAADNSIGLLVNADNTAFNAVKELRQNNTLETMPAPFRQPFFDYLRFKILLAIAFEIITIFLIYKFLNWVQGTGGEVTPATSKLVIALVSILIYAFLSIVYTFVAVLATSGTEGFEVNKDLILSFVPGKAIFYTAYSVPYLFPSAPAAIELAKNASLQTQPVLLVNGTGGV